MILDIKTGLLKIIPKLWVQIAKQAVNLGLIYDFVLIGYNSLYLCG